MGDSNCLINAVIVGVLISLVLPRLLLSFAEPGEVKLPQNLDNVSMKHKLTILWLIRRKCLY